MPGKNHIESKLEERRSKNALRALTVPKGLIDFCSNDYLGLARNEAFQDAIAQLVKDKSLSHGSTGSRLLSGNYAFIEETEKKIAAFHQTEAALVFNSGFDANLGLISCMAGRDEVILYDNLIHASLRDGIRLSPAHGFSFQHNNMEKLEQKLKQHGGKSFVVVESVYSMDGDKAPLQDITSLCKRYGARVVVDEAHATGVVGARGEGCVQQLGLQADCFARIHTFGKGLGVHGAAIVGSNELKQYLVNFARPFIYSTALPPVSAAAINVAYDYFPRMRQERSRLNELIRFFQDQNIPFEKLPSDTPIQILITPGNDYARGTATRLQAAGFDIRPILYPTVPAGKERLRLVLHSYNQLEEVRKLTDLLATSF